MRPVGYDVGIPMLLDQTRKHLEAEAEKEADDVDIEVLSGPPQGTKRKTPPTSVETPRRLAPRSWNMSSEPLQSRPKRSTVNSNVNYREDSFDSDFELSRIAGPSSSDCQPRRIIQ